MKKTKRKLVTLFMVIMLLAVAIPVQAAETNEDAEISTTVPAEIVQDGETQELEYTVVTDKAGMLEEAQIKNIEDKVAELEDYEAALYIETADQKTCIQSYANSLSEQMYDKIFGDFRNGVVVVFSFYDEACGYYAVHYGANVNLSESKMKNIIEGTYHDFKTDSTWVEGSFIQCIDYLKTVKPATSESAATSEKTTRSKLEMILFCSLIVALITIAVLGYSYWSIRSRMKDLEEFLDSTTKQLREKKDEVALLNANLDSSNKSASELQEWQKNAILVRPSIQEEIDDRIAKDQAADFDRKYSKIVTLEPVVENFDRFNILMESYETLSDSAKNYVTLDIKTASKKRQTTGELYAEEATKKIERVCDTCTGSRHDRSKLNQTVNYYNGLPMFVRLMIAQSLINRLNGRRDEAEAAQRRYRNSQSSYHSSSNHRSGSSFGGGFHGGGTFGGGFRGGH